MNAHRLALLLAGCGLAAGLLTACRPVQPRPSAGSPPLVTITSDKPGTQAGVNQSDNQVVIDLYSETGIGGATLTWPVPEATTNPAADPAADPAATLDVVLHVHSKGLEELTLDAGPLDANKVQVTAAVSSSPPHVVRESARTGDASFQPIDAQNPYWLAITWPPAAGNAPAIPLSEGFFTVSIPHALLEAGQGHIAIRWIDFYR